jgi:hypothetical protein
MNFNETKFLENAPKIHLKPEELPTYAAIADADVRVKLDEFVDYDANPRFSATLGEICENLVGRTMFKLLITKMIAGNTLKTNGKIKIQEQDEKPKGSRFSSKEWAVKINSDFYEPDGTGISDRQYYGVTEEAEVDLKLKSMAGSAFHEFCHALHYISGTNMKYKIYNICISVELQEVWGEDEEFRTINCHGHDPICDHCFDLVQSILKSKLFLPRCSHNVGYRSEKAEKDGENKEKLRQQFLKYKDLLEGWRDYVL